MSFIKIFLTFLLNLDFFLLPLGRALPNIFSWMENHQFEFNVCFFSRQELLDILLVNIYFFLTILTVGYIYFILFYNMFSYSLIYYLANLFFDFQRVSAIYEYEIRRFWDFLVAGFFDKSKYLKKRILVFQTADNLAVAMLFLLTYVYISYNFYIGNNYPLIDFSTITIFYSINVLKWISFSYDSIMIGFIVDHLSILMLIVVLSISTLVHYYSIDYMAKDPRLLVFLKYLSGFTLAMVVLVTASNFALLFLGWEGVGIFSYLLIGFWYTWTLALKASLKAVIVNWIGDAALVIASALVFHYFGTLDFKWLLVLLPYLFSYKFDSFTLDFWITNISILTLISFFLLVAAIGKSAQFGLHTWLPDAMEGPTPVSALIHAATMVTAGVYLIVRTSVFFEFSDSIKALTLVVGAFTALFGSITACFQYDIKRIIAFSTCSQLGYMFLACGLSAYNLAMFHLFIHAFFKALLFLCAGSIIHAIGDEQDIRKMGGLFYYLPITYTGLCVGFLSLAGIPFTSGFFSKDTIIELALTNWSIPALYGYICASLGAFFTSLYSCKFFYYVIFMDSKLSRAALAGVHEHGWNMLTVIFILSLVTVFIGGLTKNPLTTPLSFIFFSDSIFVLGEHFYFNLYESFLRFYVKIHHYVFHYLKLILFVIPPVAIYFGVVFFWFIDLRWAFLLSIKLKYPYWYQEGLFFPGPFLKFAFQKFFETKSGADQIYNKFIVKPLLIFSYQVSYKELDRGWLEYFFVKLPTFFCFFFSKILNQTFGSLKLNFLPALVFIFTLLVLLFNGK